MSATAAPSSSKAETASHVATTCSARAATASSGSRRSRPATKSIGKVIVTPIEAAIHGPSSTISRPISSPTSPSYAAPRAAWTIRSPTSANTPAAAATAAKETSDVLTTCRLARAGESEPRESGTLETSPSDEAVTATSAAATK